jgi:trk system potassium uptake protein TrkH
MTVPLVLVLIYGEFHQGPETLEAFLLPAALSLFLGIFLQRVLRARPLNRLQSALICSVGWLGFSAIGALPFMIGIHSTYLDGFFEAMSGFTTTGITMFTGLDQMPKSILFWRAMTQWVGGLGILTMFMLVAFRGGSPHKLFGAEGHKINVDRPVPGLANTIRVLFIIYAGFTCFIALALFALGMPLFDSICHSFTTLSTGGFSPHDASIEYYRLSGYPNYVWFDYVITLGMLIGIFVALILFERFVRVAPLVHISASSLDFWRRLEEDFRLVLFQVVSILTTTGFGTRDINTPFFGEAARQFFLVMMVIGGCVGSTGGGIKVLRIAIMGKLIRREVYRLRVPPRAINSVIIDGELVELDEIQRVGGLFFMWIVLLIFGGGVTEYLSHHNGYAALSGMFSALGNIGPCYIPVAEMGQLHPLIKVVYILGMLAGRLEILPVLLLFSLKAWRS